MIEGEARSLRALDENLLAAVNGSVGFCGNIRHEGTKPLMARRRAGCEV
jgi:hypothetical protein